MYDMLSSPLGELTIAANNEAITELHIEGDRYFTQIPTNWTQNTNHPLIQKAKQQLTEYFNGQRKNFDLPLQFSGTPFQQSVWQHIQTIPLGQTITYKQLAEKIGKPSASRAVGTAVGRNPICIIIPCHRILGTNGSLGGYVAGLEKKEKLLQLEEVLI